MPKKIVTLTELAGVTREVLAVLPLNQTEQATILALIGGLGSGKTTFTQFLAKNLGIKPEQVLSPTFVLQKTYPISSHPLFKRLIHIDCYRLDSPHDLSHLNWLDLRADPSNLIVIEWADKIESSLPAKHLKIEFTVKSETERLVKWEVD